MRDTFTLKRNNDNFYAIERLVKALREQYEDVEVHIIDDTYFCFCSTPQSSGSWYEVSNAFPEVTCTFSVSWPS